MMNMPLSAPDPLPYPGRHFDAFLFDMDGTLITSVESANRNWTRWAEMRGLDPAYVISIMHGVRTVETMQRLGFSDPKAEADLITRWEIEDTKGIRPIAGATDFLAGLPRDRWAIVTSAPIALARARLAAAGIEIPPVIVTSEDVVHGKPDPTCFRIGAARLNRDPKQCLVFEDTLAGLAAADASGAAALAITAAHEQALSLSHPAVRDYRGLTVAIDPEGLMIVPAANG